VIWRPRAGAVLAPLAGVLLAAGLLHTRETRYPLAPVPERLLYLRSGAVAGRLMLSFDAVAADLYWIRAIQHYGRDRKALGRAGRFELLEPLLDLTTTLDPHFLIAYRFGAIFLAMEPPNGPGRVDQAIALLEKGRAANPDRWQLPYDIGFVHYLHTGDFTAAADWFDRAGQLPGAPAWIAPLAATTRLQGGNRDQARGMLRQLLASEEEYIRRSAERTLQQVDALDAIDLLQQQVETFRQRTGRAPSGWQEMVTAGAIPGVPIDQHRVPFALDPSAGRVTLSRESPLWPLPGTLAVK
jgi:tetratricopeptide (TPR) repeat protein